MGALYNDRGYGITTDLDGNILTTGVFGDTVDFDPDTGVFNINTWRSRDLFIQKLDSSGKFIWAKHVSGDNQDYGLAITTDAAGAVYTTGEYYRGSSTWIDFDPGPSSYSLRTLGISTAFIQKLDANGNFRWARAIGGRGNYYNKGFTVNTDSLANVYITGQFQGRSDFNTDAGLLYLTAIGGRDIFTLKLDSAGKFLWVSQIGSTGDDFGFSAVDQIGNVYTTGNFMDTVDFDPDTTVFNLISNGSRDVFIQKLDSGRNLEWVKQIGGNGWDAGGTITVDKLGNIYVLGSFSDTVDFDPDTSVQNLIASSSGNIFILKLNDKGEFEWVKQLGSDYYYKFVRIVSDENGDVYMTGEFRDSMDFDPGIGVSQLVSKGLVDMFILKLNSNGTFAWVKQVESTASNDANDIAVDERGNVFVTGAFGGTTDFDPDTSVFNLVGQGNSYDIFILKLNQAPVPVGLEYKFSDNDAPFLIYPNPSNGEYNIRFKSREKIARISVYNSQGRLLKDSEFKDVEFLRFNINYPSGVYFINVITSSGRQTVSVINR